MKYPYLTVLNSDPNGKHFRRPVVDVEIFGSNRTINTFALLDSGADNCLFHLEYAKEIGIDLDKCKKFGVPVRHHFPFTGLFRCGECESMITAQWCTNRFGTKYRYYRCTKKNGKYGQEYLREDRLVLQLKEHLQKISLPDEWTDWMTKQTDEWEKDEKSSSGTLLVQLKEYERETEQKLSELVNLYPDGDIPKENYLAKKNELLKEKVSLNEKLKSARAERKNWVEPLREWILDIKKATQLTSSDNFFEIKDYFKKIGTNSVLREKSVSISFCPPTEFACARKAGEDFSHPLLTIARERATIFSSNFPECVSIVPS